MNTNVEKYPLNIKRFIKWLGHILQVQEIAGSHKPPGLLQERLAEAARIALNYNLINITDSITNFLSRIRQLNQRAYIMNEYNKVYKNKNETYPKK